MKIKKPKPGFMDCYKKSNNGNWGSPDEWRFSFRQAMSLDEAEEILGGDEPLDILNLTRKSTMAEIKRAYRAAAMKYHPDRNEDKIWAEKMFKKIHAAYVKLGGKA